MHAQFNLFNSILKALMSVIHIEKCNREKSQKCLTEGHEKNQNKKLFRCER
jgi:hypothetical protein